MNLQIDVQNKSTKQVILEYLKNNRGREIPVSEISEKFNFKLARISNAIKELELSREIKVERRPIKKGKFTVLSLLGDTITQFATHNRAIEANVLESVELPSNPETFPVLKVIELLTEVKYDSTKLEKILIQYSNSFISLACFLIQPVMYEVGVLWQKGELTIGDEHIISRRMEKIITGLINNQPIGSKKIVILAPAEHEQHTLGLKVLELLLIERGHIPINLSFTLSAYAMVSFLKKGKIKPDWVFYSITMNSFVNNLRMDVSILREELKLPNLKIAVGGQGIKDLDKSEFTEADRIVRTNDDLQDLLLSL